MPVRRLRVAGTAVAALAVCVAAGGEETIRIDAGWRFAAGDRPERAAPGFDASGWEAINVDRIWEEQGHDPLDGYAWYRLRVTIPARLRDAAQLQDGLRIGLGKINNFDQSFLNGRLFGVNGAVVPAGTPADDGFTKAEMAMWDVERIYVLPPDDERIRWGEENVIAVRVFDQGGQGGMWSGGQSLRMVALADYLASDASRLPFVAATPGLTKRFTLSNTSARHTLAGTLAVRGVGKLTGATVLERSEPISLAPLAARTVELALPALGESALVETTVTFAPSGQSTAWREETPYLLTPPPPAAPRINGPAVIGARPGRPFLYAVPASGQRPLEYAAAWLPEGLHLDPITGIVTGTVAKPGTYTVAFTAVNAHGRATRKVDLAVGDSIALTPPLGWNSWNAWGLAVDEEKVLAAARAFREKGLADHGWTYVNIDDGWEIKGDAEAPKRNENGSIITNEKFPDMKRLADAVHAMGLKLGIYSSPGPLTCGGYTGSWEHERHDARSWAAWGIDYLKYDWCSYDTIAKDRSRRELMKPYALMRRMLDAVDRDIVYSLCQYGMGEVWTWGETVGGNLWRTTGDITDTWESMSGIGFSQVRSAPFAGPGHWNDPDMLVVGWVGWGPSLHPTRLTPDEQYTHISLWSLLAAPLLIGCDLERLDDFTLNLLTNDEVLAVDQDRLGRQATPVWRRADHQVWVKELEGGAHAVGVFNLGAATRSIEVPLRAIGLKGAWAVRDLWRQKDLDNAEGAFSVAVPSHGVALLRLRRP